MAFIAIFALISCKEVSEEKKEERIKIKVQYVCGRMNLDLESVLEEEFPYIDIVTDELVGGADYIIAKEMEIGEEADIYLYEGLRNMDDSIIREKLYDLSQEEFTNNFYLSAVTECMNEDGGLYFLPGPIYVYGIVYDKTAFRELGLDVPKSYTEFKDLLERVRDMELIGYEPDENGNQVPVLVEPFVPTVKWADMFSFIFDAYMYDDYFKGVDNALWLSRYQRGDESMIGHMEGAAEKLIKLLDDGILLPSFWEMRAPVRSVKLYRYHTSLMTIECQSAIGFNERENADNPENLHEMGMMPFFSSDKEGTDYLVSMPRCYFGMTKRAAEDEKKKNAILEIFNFFSTKEGQDLLIEGGGGEINYLKNSNLTDDSFYDDVRETFKEGRVISRIYLDGKVGTVESYLHKNTLSLVEGKITIQEFLEGADRVRDEVLENKVKEEFSYGESMKNFSVEETASIVGEAYLNSYDADIAIVPVRASFGMKNRLFKGPITDTAINNLMTTRMVAGVEVEDPNHINLVTVQISGKEILELLEKNKDTFVAITGMDVVYDTRKAEGERYVSIKYNGKEVLPSDVFTAISVKGFVKDIKTLEVHDDLKFKEIFVSYIESKGGVISQSAKGLEII